MGSGQVRHASTQCGGERGMMDTINRERSINDQVTRKDNAMVMAGKL